jgi:hypothetical protein
MPNLVWKTDMKVKEIVYEDGQLPGQGVAGKVTKVNQPMGDKPGSVDVTMPNGITSQIPSNMVTKGPDGKPMANTQTANTNSATSPDQQIQPGTDIKVQEQPTGFVAPVNTKSNPPMVMDNGNTGGSPLGITSTGEEINPALVARSSDWQERPIQANGKTYNALYSGTRGYRVGKKSYEEITGGTAPAIPAGKTMPTQPATTMPAQPAPTRESADDQLLKSMLVIAGLK